jgi:uncharacterized protein
MDVCVAAPLSTQNIFPMSDLTATSGQERIVELDLMRGFALFGILIVNMLFFGMPIYTIITDLNPLNDPLDEAARYLIGIVFEGKFITLFSFMFGLGFWIFISRARAKDRTAGPLFLRRLFILALIGAAHAFLFWAGDILLFYAMLGLVMMLFLNRTDKTLRVWIALLPVLHILMIVAFVAFFKLGMSTPEGAEVITEALDEARIELEAMAASAMEIYRTGTFTEMMEIRRQELAFAYQGFIMGGVGVFYLLAVFLAGMYAGRAGWFTNIAERLPALRRYVPWTLLFGFACAIPGFLLMRGADIITPGWNMPLYLSLFIVGTPALTFSYVILLLSAFHRFGTGKRIGNGDHTGNPDGWFWPALRDTGRMSLTVYLTQSLVMTTIFFSYGLGLYGSMPAWMMTLLAVSFFAVQMVVAHWWMKHFTMGPLEWLWRAATYGYIPKLKKSG